ncbi:similar to Saccharomyces cerevisiae YDR285W ZIP1 Transverse filament protein of the synaptonemal complex [Maudiozyma saulgeensis]|uniref:Similar to Saccharomyces cerevisiae YDR285W ZIP1 Transverse filament protein of the synaptonemal complex n=1 Tax=Maudiozyma saulgeensis TaxID=1789683 RepID=A0A1X7R591_9SACH|nr:similar to Saccharomyces cerevisiae YDR285W ZIP1 Transverse filament protein of the synaptonemal complex [Kazachstania saulgeensis]
MPNFFRDSTLGFKPRSNIFNKLRTKEFNENVHESENIGNTKSGDNDGDSSMMNYMFSDGDDSIQTINQTKVSEPNSYSSDNIKKLSTSTPRTLKTSTSSGSGNKITQRSGTKEGNAEEDEEDFEITEVRNIDPDLSPSSTKVDIDTFTGKHPKVTSNLLADDKFTNVDTSSNDVLLEAFTNTQRICSNLKIELQKQNSENGKLKSKLNNFEKETKNMQDKVTKYKIILNGLQDKTTELFKKRNLDNSHLSELKKFQDELQRRINTYKEELIQLKSQMIELQKLKHSLESELMKKDKDLEYVKQELDDCSGQLTEEKLKNSSLLEEILLTRNITLESFDKKFSQMLSETKTLTTSTEETLNKNFENQKSIYVQQQEELFDEDLKKILNGELLQVSNWFEKLDKSLLINYTNFENELNLFQTKIIDQLVGSDLKIDEIANNMIILLKEKCQSIISETNSELHVLHEKLEGYQNELTKSHVYESNVAELEKQISSLEQQKTENLVNLGTRNAELEDLRIQLESQSIELSNTKSIDSELTRKLEMVEQESGKLKEECKKLNEILITEKGNFQNKIAAQEGISSAIKSENSSLKSRIQELEGIRNSYETEQTSRIDKFQRLNEQLQKMNVEMIQLKARELELLEENKNLNNKIMDDTTGYETSLSEVNNLKRCISDMDNDKQELLSERLDLQDKLEEMQRNMVSLRNKNSNHEKTIKELTKQLEKKVTNDSQQHLTTDDEIERIIVTPVKPQNKPREEKNKKKNIIKTKTDVVNTMKFKKFTDDEFDLPSSLNDDFEMTDPSPIHLKPVRAKSKRGHPPDSSVSVTKKKLLLVDPPGTTDFEVVSNVIPKRKKRKN